ncbi:MAG: DNA cytosine methyltransferase [Clostridium sp.]|nr:DNA cytosine methyltransferase [Clostridium sp.]
MTQTNLFDYLIVDNFAGGGGASCGIELATGRPVNIAINHDPAAIAMHKANHPYTEHYQESVWDIDPKEICRGQPVGLAWFSPDCKHFSKAKGGKPVDKNIRGLAWIVLKWAGMVRPRVIILENVEEFQTWGPVRKGRPVKSKQGETFERWKNQLKALGYEIEYRELKACDYGAPTIRKRFFLIARCDGEPIVWPEPTHGPADSPEVKSGKLKPYKTAADCIDFTLPCKSIFDRKKPLAVNTQRRIARGLDKFVIKESKPFIVHIGNGERKGQLPRVQDIDKPISTVVSSCKQYFCTPYLTKFQQLSKGQSIKLPLDTVMPGATRFGLIAPALIQYHSETAKAEVRGQSLDKPIMTVDSSPRYGVFIPYLSKYFGGVVGADVQSPMPTVTAIDHNALSMPFLTQYYSGADHANTVRNPLQTVTVQPRHYLCKGYLTVLRNNMDCRSVQAPLPTVTTSGAHFAYTKVYVKKYNPGCNLYNWSKVRVLLNTYTDWNLANDEILIFNINGVEQFIYDIGLRMLQPKELYKAQGFPDDYIIETDCNGKAYPKSKQVARCGNAVPPPFAKALVMANCPWLCDKHCNNMTEFNSVAAG